LSFLSLTASKHPNQKLHLFDNHIPPKIKSLTPKIKSLTQSNTMGFKKYIPDFLLPTEEVQQSTRIYDQQLRRHLFSKAEAGNEHSISASRNSSVVIERRASEGMAVPYGRSGSVEQNAHVHAPHGLFRWAD
jgi:predicted nuclease of restriction endonuclease-like RecB superfamily